MKYCKTMLCACALATATALSAGSPFKKESKPYQIPLRSCRAADLDNLYMAGRCISGDFFTQASYRITGTAVEMGYNVGVAAAGS